MLGLVESQIKCLIALSLFCLEVQSRCRPCLLFQNRRVHFWGQVVYKVSKMLVEFNREKAVRFDNLLNILIE